MSAGEGSAHVLGVVVGLAAGLSLAGATTLVRVTDGGGVARFLVEDTGAVRILADDPASPALTVTQTGAGGGVQITDGTQGASRVLTCDASGLASWLSVPPAAPIGIVLSWSGPTSAIPAGWALCDGTPPTPDLRDRFVLGAQAGQDPGGSGGSHTRTLSASNLPAHTHGLGTSSTSGASHTHGFPSAASGSVHTHGFTTGSAGGTHSHTATLNPPPSAHNHSVTTSNGGAHAHTYTNYLSNLGVWTLPIAPRRPGLSTSGPYTTTTSLGGGHSHSGGVSSAGGHAHSGSTGSGGLTHTHSGSTGNGSGHTHTGATGNGADHTHTGTTGSVGGGAAFDNRPSYYKLAFIMKL